jgi:hypothetical protein
VSIYCTYITIYKGNDLPLFYIGSSSVKKVKEGYKGSVSSAEYKEKWKHHIKNNPDLFNTKILTKHKTRKQASIREAEIQEKLNVVENPLYLNKTIIHEKFVNKPGYKLSEETKQKQKDSWKLRPPSRPKGFKMSEEHKAKLRKPKSSNKNYILAAKKRVLPEVVCPHCGKIGRGNGMHRHIKSCRDHP